MCNESTATVAVHEWPHQSSSVALLSQLGLRPRRVNFPGPGVGANDELASFAYHKDVCWRCDGGSGAGDWLIWSAH